MVGIRTATENDIEIIKRFIADLASLDSAADEVDITSDQLINDYRSEKFGCLLAEEDGSAVGFAIFFESYSSWKGPCMFIDDLFINKEHRNKGIGKLFFKELSNIAKERKYKRIDWNTDIDNKNAQSFYEHLGAERQDDTIYYRFDERKILDF
jgi:GNAT superfamily N-acetyltransferase